ncbi:phage tail assembly protein [Vibrio algicola]|nr:phage tail assembly protein [Vibrio algicola]
MTKAKYPVLKKDIKLAYPVALANKTVETLSMRRPTVRELLLMEKHQGDDLEKDLYMMGLLCEVDDALLHQLDAMDFIKLQECYKGFFMPEKESEISSED